MLQKYKIRDISFISTTEKILGFLNCHHGDNVSVFRCIVI